jgi:hypothetical protein
LGVFAALAILGLGAIGLRGRGLGMFAQAKISWVSNTIKAVQDRHSVAPGDDLTNIIFLHHSTGRNLIRQGNVRRRLSEAGYQFWDHDYNAQGLTRPDGMSVGYNYSVPDDNTDPDGLAHIFSQRRYALPLNTFSSLMQHKVIVFKSCFPVSHIASDAQLEQYKTYYLQMRDVMAQHPDHLFIALSPPPLNPAATDAEAAARARAFAEWLSSDDFLSRHPNIFSFDLFDHLAEDKPDAPDRNMLRADYRKGQDSHPNEIANKTVGPLLADFIMDAIRLYRANADKGPTQDGSAKTILSLGS